MGVNKIKTGLNKPEKKQHRWTTQIGFTIQYIVSLESNKDDKIHKVT